MVELREVDETMLVKTFAGDTYNTAVYAKRCNPELEVHYLSAYGGDAFSLAMNKQWQQQQLNTDLCVYLPERNTGIYNISLDAYGERSFSYWRKGSAASELMQYLDTKMVIEKSSQFKIVFFTGITLAIMSDKGRQTLLDLISSLKQKGCKIAFDPNYRALLWNKQDARNWIQKAYDISDIILPGLDDHQSLFGHQSLVELLEYFSTFNVSELVIKCGELGVYGYTKGAHATVEHVPFVPAKVQVDTTAAGDSFAGAYLNGAIEGMSMNDKLTLACDVARMVVQHPGAIIDEKIELV